MYPTLEIIVGALVGLAVVGVLVIRLLGRKRDAPKP